MKSFILLILLLPLPAMADNDWRFTARGGHHYYLDGAYDLVFDVPLRGAGEFGLDWVLWSSTTAGSLGIGVAYEGGGMTGVVHQNLATNWTVQSLRAHAIYRWQAVGPLVLFGRVGPALHWTALALEGFDGRVLEAEGRGWGAHGGLGVDYLFIEPELMPHGDQLGFGVSLEATYAQFGDLDLEAGGTRLGAIDPSGPGWLFGLVLTW
jgi:hypothetical protein